MSIRFWLKNRVSQLCSDLALLLSAFGRRRNLPKPRVSKHGVSGPKKKTSIEALNLSISKRKKKVTLQA
jgi:hypothetical protein